MRDLSSLFVWGIGFALFFNSTYSEASHPMSHMPSPDFCYKASLHFLNNEALAEYSGIPNPPQATSAEELRASSVTVCTAYLDGAMEGARRALGFEAFSQYCGIIRMEGLGAYASMFIPEGWPYDFGRRQAQNLAIACDHTVLRGHLRGN